MRRTTQAQYDIRPLYKEAEDAVRARREDAVEAESVPLYYDIATYYPALPVADEVIFRLAVTRSFTLPVDCAGSYCAALIAPTADMELWLYKNAERFGTIYMRSGVTGGAFYSASVVSFAVGDTFSIVCKSSDATLAGISTTFVGTRGDA